MVTDATYDKLSSMLRYAFLAGTVAVTSCSDNGMTGVLKKFAESELHPIGAECVGPFLAIRGGNLVHFDGARHQVNAENVTLKDVGSHRISMSWPQGKGALVLTFLLKHDDTVAVIEGIRAVPDFTPEQWASPQGARLRKKLDAMRDTTALVLCPPSKT
ncbi:MULTISPECIES: hypothetical protein [unclassified Rhizobium]|uniref:hypothetical protein n=1 Tax=unclassified Rhizobium TaxID=2613769 RepID=UPI001ADAC954|nr:MULTISPECIES: hypothetical protein [unclassified Rhizobium]MBO9125661.1 hypothetical protein [Rhizobium sp. 16-488-2b]MBO9176245.1 hypothetical protein [Rhizobium sp. 16-488-2a]